MPTSLNIRDIGEERKAALEKEAKASDTSVAEIVRSLIDDGIARSRAKREQEEWIAAAKQGLADEAAHFEKHGSLLARFRRF